MADVHDRLREFWDEDARTYDRAPSHAASDPVEAAAWRGVLLRHLPPPGSSVLDAGAGTGAMSLLLAELGYQVTALDLSPRMLARAQQKAGRRELAIETVVAPATEPPPGPFDAVVVRHLLWTLPEPVEALRAWRSVASRGRLLVAEALLGGRTVPRRASAMMARVARSVLGVERDHHATYDQELVHSLPLIGVTSPAPWIEAMTDAGWRSVRVERLRDVEWARRIASPWPIGWLEAAPQFALIADAQAGSISPRSA